MKNLNTNQIVIKALSIRGKILEDKLLKTDLDTKLDKIPQPYLGIGLIKIFIIGQDPTVQRKESREGIKTVLNLDKPDSLYKYINNEILIPLGCTMENLYATNYYKCFFKVPPAEQKGILTRHFRYWLDLIKEELSYFPDAKVITLGEPLIEQLILSINKKVRHYWDYTGNTTSGEKFKCVESKDNVLGSDFFPLPHQPNYNRNKFYKKYLKQYLEFVNRL